MKCSGLDAMALARRSVEPATMSLLGLVRHMAEVERSWFRRVLTGEQNLPKILCWEAANPDGDVDGAVPGYNGHADLLRERIDGRASR